MKVDVDYWEYDCGYPCTPNGCPGHITDIPVSIIIDGVTFYVEGYEGGDFPPRDPEKIEKIIKVVDNIIDRLER